MPDEPFTDAGESFASSQMVRDWLRKPFKPEQIGKLPATPKRPALDFVGHAAVTDRLNKIAPDWSYTVDELLLPTVLAPGREPTGKVWIRGTMTIGGVSRPEFGDGDDPKEAIGNFIRRGAMRFGVAIDLWSREELESAPAMEASADAGGRVETSSSASRESSVGEGEAPASAAPGEGSSGGSSPSLGADHPAMQPSKSTVYADGVPLPAADHPGPPHYALEPKDCSHKRTTGTYGRLSPRKSPRGPVCPRCGLSYITVKESTTADLGAA